MSQPTHNLDHTALWPENQLEEFKARGQRFLTALPPPPSAGAAEGLTPQFVPSLQEFVGYFGKPSSYVGVLRPQDPKELVEHELATLRAWMDSIRAQALTDSAGLYAQLEPHMSAWVHADKTVEQQELYGALALAQLLFSGAYRNQFPSARSSREAVAQFLKSHKRGGSESRITCLLSAAEFFWEIHGGNLPLPPNLRVIERLAPQTNRFVIYRGLVTRLKRAPTQAEVIGLLVERGVQRVGSRDRIKTEVAKRARALVELLGKPDLDRKRALELAGEIHAAVKPLFGRRRRQKQEVDDAPLWDTTWGCPFALRREGPDLLLVTVSGRLPAGTLAKFEKQATDLGWLWHQGQPWAVPLCRDNTSEAFAEANHAVELCTKLCVAISAPIPPAFPPEKAA